MQLAEIEQAFKELNHDLAIRPIFHRREDRIEAHIFVAFIAYCLHVTLKNLARPRAPGLPRRSEQQSIKQPSNKVDSRKAHDFSIL